MTAQGTCCPPVRRTCLLASLLALALLLRALPAHAQDTAGAQLQKAAAQVAAGKMAEAEQIVQRVLKTNPNQAAALNLLGVIRAGSGKSDEAEPLFRRAVRSDPKFADAYGNLGILYRQRGDMNAARPMLEKAVEFAPRAPRNRYNLAMLYAEQGNFTAAITQMLAIAANQRPADYWTKLATFYIALEKFADGEQCLERELAAHPDAIPTLRQLAGLALKRDDVDAAGTYLARAVRVAPNSAELLFEYAQIQRRAHRVNDTIVTMRRVLLLEPDRPEYVELMGAALLESAEEYPKALPYFERYVEMEPQEPRAHLALAFALIAMKDHGRARREIEQALQLDPNMPEAHYQLGMMASENGNAQEAIQHLSRLLELKPGHLEGLILIATVYQRVGQLAKARAALETAEQLDAGNVRVHYRLSQVCLGIGDVACAEREKRRYEELQAKTGVAPTPSATQVTPQ